MRVYNFNSVRVVTGKFNVCTIIFLYNVIIESGSYLIQVPSYLYFENEKDIISCNIIPLAIM